MKERKTYFFVIVLLPNCDLSEESEKFEKTLLNNLKRRSDGEEISNQSIIPLFRG